MSDLRHSLFVPHGSPMFALHPGAAGAAMSQLAHQLPTLRAIVVVSPHWETAVPTVGTAAQLKTIHDFGGFDPRLYSIQYPAVGCSEAAQWVIQHLRSAGFPVEASVDRGLDHGAWVPLRQMFPDADVPVVPLSIQPHLGPDHAYRVGQALASLATQGYLVLASGNITHNLRDWQLCHTQDLPTPAYVAEFSNWIHDHLVQRDTASLLNYRQLQPHSHRAHPRDEHLLPLFTALGAAGADARPMAFYRGISDHVISMDGYAFQ